MVEELVPRSEISPPAIYKHLMVLERPKAAALLTPIPKRQDWGVLISDGPMFRWIKRLLVLSFVVGILAAGSYAGARFEAGKVLGIRPPLGGQTVEFAFKGTDDLDGNPRVWVFTYSTSRLPRVRQAKIYVTATGRLVATEPSNLADLLEAWEKSLQP